MIEFSDKLSKRYDLMREGLDII